jgi:hypothetical protein
LLLAQSYICSLGPLFGLPFDLSPDLSPDLLPDLPVLSFVCCFDVWPVSGPLNLPLVWQWTCHLAYREVCCFDAISLAAPEPSKSR